MSELHPEIRIMGPRGVITGVLRTHARGECALPHCCIHNPTEHPLRSAPLVWREDLRLIYRECPHGLLHPDVDSAQYVFAVFGEMAAAVVRPHNCDGCCGGDPWPPGQSDAS